MSDIYLVTRDGHDDVREYWNSYHGVWGTDRRMATRLLLVDARICASDEDGDVRRLRVKKAAPGPTCTDCDRVSVARMKHLDEIAAVLTVAGVHSWQAGMAPEVAGVVSERDALKARVGELEDLLAICDGLDAMIIPERDALRAERAEMVATLRLSAGDDLRDEVRLLDGERSRALAELADAIRERDAAVSEGDRQRERAKRAESMLADSKDSARLVYGYVKREHYVADIARVEGEKSAALARADLAESRLAQVAALVGAGK